MNVVLIGMMGSGKSTVGKMVAGKLNWKFLDSDQFIENEENASISDIFRNRGEKTFRQIEKKLIRYIAQEDRAIIATGGGVPCYEDNWNALSKNGVMVWLKSDPQHLMERIKKGSPNVRPLLNGNSCTLQNISQILNERERFYGKAQAVIEVDNSQPEEIAEKIVALTVQKMKEQS